MLTRYKRDAAAQSFRRSELGKANRGSAAGFKLSSAEQRFDNLRFQTVGDRALAAHDGIDERASRCANAAGRASEALSEA